jgi:N-acetylglutamate synthase-like GNAT family acetyltransferase
VPDAAVPDRERAVGFLRETYRRRAERVERFPWGELVATPSLPLVWDANFALVERWDGSAVELRDEMDHVQQAFAHRRVVLAREDVAAALWEDIGRSGWEFASRYLLMAQRRLPDRAADQAIEIVGVGELEWARGRRAMIEAQAHGADAELGRQLMMLDARLAQAMEVRHLAAVVDGEIAAYAGLYLEEGTAQIEDVATLPRLRNRGLARAVVLAAIAEARRAGAELVFLVADEADWPVQLYERLGFDPIGIEHVFGRSGRQHSST